MLAAYFLYIFYAVATAANKDVYVGVSIFYESHRSIMFAHCHPG